MVPVNVLPSNLLTANKWLRPEQGEILSVNNRNEISTLNISLDIHLHIKYFSYFTIIYHNIKILL